MSDLARSLFDPPYQSHSPTSRGAAQGARKTRPATRQIVLAALAQACLTDEELTEATGLGANTVRPRRVELVRDGLVGPAGTRPTRSGHQAVVWRAVGHE